MRSDRGAAIHFRDAWEKQDALWVLPLENGEMVQNLARFYFGLIMSGSSVGGLSFLNSGKYENWIT